MRDHQQAAQSVFTQHATLITDSEKVQLRSHDDSRQPTLIHLPGLHGDWTLLGPFRSALTGRARLVECTYPRQPDWSLSDYARAIENALLEHGITSGWILGESFSSQVAWQLLARQPARNETGQPGFKPDGLILVGGFIRHPWPWGVRAAHSASRVVPMKLLRFLCKLYGKSARRRFCRCPEIVAELDEFVERRANETDRQVITRRYQLIAGNDLRPTARSVSLPVYHLSGAWDPIVPWWQVRPWLRRNCPGCRASRIIWSGGHNVLLSAPEKSAEQILEWINQNEKQERVDDRPRAD